MNETNTSILPGAGPFFFKGNDIGILLFHGGGGGTCADLKPLARELYDLGGYTVSVPLLPGYGRSPEILKETTIREWKEEIKKELNSLKKSCKKIFVGGHSMGGLLTLITASEFDLNGIFLISTPIGFGSKLPLLVPLLKLFIKYYPVGVEELKEETQGKWVGYDKIPLNLVGKIKKLMKEMKTVLPRIKIPVLIMQGQLDTVIKKNSMDFIYRKIGSKEKEKVWLEHNDHPILDCPDHEVIVEKVNEFIKKYS
ncbi:MAG: alpha/beta hydrolase [Promethearchaeota archaeon]